MRQIVLDTETTGLLTEEGHRIIEIGCLELVNRKFTGKRFHQYINPERDIEEEALAVHGITKSFLEDKPKFAEVVHELMEFITDAELLIHNAPFDVKFIDHELSLTQQKWKPLSNYCRVIDTLVIARQLHVGQRNSLDALCKRYSIDNSQREFHGALLDAHLLAQVYLAMTGGQGSLFDKDQDKVQQQTEVQTVKPLTAHARKLIVISPTAEELALHEMKLQKMAEKGKCVWQE